MSAVPKFLPAPEPVTSAHFEGAIELDLIWSLEGSDNITTKIRAHYTVEYPSIRHRGANVGGTIRVRCIETDQAHRAPTFWCRDSLPSAIHNKLIEAIADDLRMKEVG